MAEGDSKEPTPLANPKTSAEQTINKVRLMMRGYLTSGANRILETARLLGPWSINDNIRKVFIEEWSHAVQSAKNLGQLTSVSNLAWDVNQNSELSSYLKSRIRTARPELKDKDFAVMANNPEYDGVRRVVGEKLKALGLTNSGINGEIHSAASLQTIFHLLHPNPREAYTYTTTRKETRGKFFKKQIEVPVEEHGSRLKPYEQLMADFLQYNQPQPTSAVPKV